MAISYRKYRLSYDLFIVAVSISTVLLFNRHPLHAQFSSLEIGSTPNPIGSGARAMGKANAFIAVADDATAASWNPGGLTQLERPEFSFAIEAFQHRESINSRDHPESETSDTLNLEDFNYASLVFPFFYKTNMVFSLNYLKLYRFDKVFETPIQFTTQNNVSFEWVTEFDQAGSFSVLAPAFAIDITYNLSIGIACNIWNHALTDSSAFDKRQEAMARMSGPDPIDPNRTRTGDFNGIIDEGFEIEEGYSIILGGLYRVNEFWTIAGVLKPAYSLDIDHKTSISSVQTGDFAVPPSFSRAKENAELDFPWIIGAGISWRPRDPFTVSMDVTWTDWSDYVFSENGFRTNPVSARPTNVEKVEDTFTVRLGSEYVVIRENHLVPLRFGVGYDPSPAVNGSDDFFTLNIGTGLQLYNRFNIDVAYEFRWGNNVNASTVPDIINGTQDVRQHRVLASLIYYF